MSENSNDVPKVPSNLWKDFRSKVWTEWLKPYLDFRAYFRQRKQLVGSPEAALISTGTLPRDWGSPLTFAVQGMFVTIFFVKAISWTFSAAFKPPQEIVATVDVEKNGEVRTYLNAVPIGESILKFKAEQAQKDLDALRIGLQEVENSRETSGFNGPVHYSARDVPLALLIYPLDHDMKKSEAEAAYNQEIEKVEAKKSELELLEYQESVSEMLEDYIPALSLFISAYLFSIFSRIGRKRYSARGRESEIFLYYITARLIFVVMTYTIINSIHYNIILHIPEMFFGTIRYLDDAVVKIVGNGPEMYEFRQREIYFLLANIGVGIWGYLVIRSAAFRLLPVLEMRPASRFWHVYSGEKKIRKDIILSNLLSALLINVAIFFASKVYGAAYLFIENIKM